jgi:hypothetical protein
MSVLGLDVFAAAPQPQVASVTVIIAARVIFTVVLGRRIRERDDKRSSIATHA